MSGLPPLRTGSESRCPQCGFHIVTPEVYETVECPRCGAQLKRKDKHALDESLDIVNAGAGLGEDEAKERWLRDHADYYKIKPLETIQQKPLTAQEARARDSAIRSGIKCMVCNLQLRKADSIVWCPYCMSAAHATHLLEWLVRKRTCPICRRELDETQLKRTPIGMTLPKNQKSPSRLG